jgi:hypothetical protein
MLPPTSGESESLPSEKAPAPAQPLIMAQGLQFAHVPVILAGHFLFDSDLPLSITSTLAFGQSSYSSSAVNMPAGPAPTIITSYSFCIQSTLFRAYLTLCHKFILPNKPRQVNSFGLSVKRYI